MKAGKYRDLFNGIDTDKATDEKIKNKLLYCQGEEPVRQGKKETYKTSGRRSKPFHFAFANISILRQALPSFAFLLFVVAIIVGVRANLIRRNVTPETNVNTSEGTPLAAQEDIDYAKDIENYMVNSNIALEDILDASNNKAETLKAGASEEGINEEESSDVTNPESSDEIASEATNDILSVTGEDSVEPEVNPVTKAEESEKPAQVGDTNSKESGNKAQVGDFYFAWFDVINENNVKAAIPNLIVRFHGTFDTIDPNDLTDIVLTRDGNPVDNGIYMTDQVIQREWSYENITDFYFAFDYENREPGIYGLTGKYQGVIFTVYNKILEAAVTDEPADPADFNYAGFGGYTDESNNFYSLTELCFGFKGHQNAFYPSDLTDLVITCNGEKMPFSYRDDVFRYYEANDDTTADTSFNLILNEPLTQSGEYIIKGSYKGVPLSSCIVSIP